MMGLKLLTVACVIAAAASNPTFGLHHGLPGVPCVGGGGGAGGIFGGIMGAAADMAGGGEAIPEGVIGGDGDVAVGASVNLDGVFRILIGGLTGLCGNAGDLLSGLFGLRYPANDDDAFNVLATLSAAIGNILDVSIPGIGGCLTDLVVGMLKICTCAFGSEGHLGGFFGIFFPERYVPNVCGSGFGVRFGCRKFEGQYEARSIAKHYRLFEAESTILSAVDEYTNGVGVEGLRGSQKIIVQWMLQLTTLVNNRRELDFSRDDLSLVVELILKIFGGIGNSYQKGLGEKIVIKLVAYFASTKKSSKFTVDLSSRLTTIRTAINKCSKDTFGGAIKDNGNQSNVDQSVTGNNNVVNQNNEVNINENNNENSNSNKNKNSQQNSSNQSSQTNNSIRNSHRNSNQSNESSEQNESEENSKQNNRNTNSNQNIQQNSNQNSDSSDSNQRNQQNSNQNSQNTNSNEVTQQNSNQNSDNSGSNQSSQQNLNQNYQKSNNSQENSTRKSSSKKNSQTNEENSSESNESQSNGNDFQKNQQDDSSQGQSGAAQYIDSGSEQNGGSSFNSSKSCKSSKSSSVTESDEESIDTIQSSDVRNEFGDQSTY